MTTAMNSIFQIESVDVLVQNSNEEIILSTTLSIPSGRRYPRIPTIASIIMIDIAPINFFRTTKDTYLFFFTNCDIVRLD